MSIRTNRLNINFNIDAIKEGFVFIRFIREQKGNWKGAAELDYLIGEDFKAVSVMFQYGKYAYAMFKKPVDVYELLFRIRANKEFNDNAVTEVLPAVSRHDVQDCICEAWLAQILFNSLSSSKSRFPKFHYCNLTGSLLLVPNFEGKNYDYLDVAKITLSPDYLLKVETVRHRKKISVLSELKKTVDKKREQELQNALNKPHYKFEASTGSLRRYLPRDGEIDAKLAYIECGLLHKKASTPFLEFGNRDDFYKSRAGIFHQVITSIHENLSKYIDVNWFTREIDHSIELNNTLLKDEKPKQLHSILDGQLIHIVDRVNSEESDDLAMTLRTLLLPYINDEELITSGRRDKKGALNFRIIHNAEFYETMAQKDEYQPSTDTFQRQHITVESIETVSKAIVKTIIKEHLIKRDISSRSFNLFDWNKLQSKGVWTFAAWDEDVNHVIFMEIQPNGNFEFYEIDSRDLFNWQKFEKYREFMIDNSSGKKIRTLEGLVISDAGDINQIFLTDEISLPDLYRIETIIKEVEAKLPENKRSGNELAELIEKFMAKNPSMDNENLVTFYDELRNVGSNEIDKNSFRKILNEKLGKSTNVASELRDYLLKEHDIWLNFPKNKERLEDLFDASLNIKYFGETEKEAYYFVGNRRDNVQFSFKDSCHLRKIVAVDNSKLIFKELLPTMDVDFVRTGQSTVIPFPFKYIREYKNFGVAK